jgi:Kef-type K+ transport system membrane component KefB
MSSPFLFNAFIFLAAACLVVPLASRFKLGSVLGYLAAGVLIGPYGLGLIGNAEQIMEFGEFGVVMMLFVIGLELEPATLWRMRKQMIGLGGLQLSLTALAFTSLGVALGFDWRMSLAAGMALSLSSTAIVLQMLQEKNLMQTQVGETSFAVLLFQDMAFWLLCPCWQRKAWPWTRLTVGRFPLCQTGCIRWLLQA